MHFLVPQRLLEGIAQYLGSRPYVEVANLIQGIGQCQLNPADQKEAEAVLAEKKEAVTAKVTEIKKKSVKKAKKKIPSVT